MTVRQCQKIGHATRADALEEIRYLTTQRRFISKKIGNNKKGGRKTRAYECRWCGQWHLTTQKPRKY